MLFSQFSILLFLVILVEIGIAIAGYIFRGHVSGPDPDPDPDPNRGAPDTARNVFQGLFTFRFHVICHLDSRSGGGQSDIDDEAVQHDR